MTTDGFRRPFRISARQQLADKFAVRHILILRLEFNDDSWKLFHGSSTIQRRGRMSSYKTRDRTNYRISAVGGFWEAFRSGKNQPAIQAAPPPLDYLSGSPGVQNSNPDMGAPLFRSAAGSIFLVVHSASGSTATPGCVAFKSAI